MKLASAAVLSAVLLSASFAAPLSAQAALSAQQPAASDAKVSGGGMHHGGPGMGRPGMSMATHVAPITNAPFSAKYTVESQHTAPGPDGVVQKFTTTEATYRDSLGRTREDISIPAPHAHQLKPGVDETTSSAAELPAVPHTITVIADPVANTVTRLMPERKIAVVETVPADFFKHALAREVKAAAGETHHKDNATTTDLGSKTFAGVVASGKRTTVTFAARSGDADAVARTKTRETWFSPDLKLEVSSTESGGRGTHSDVLTTLTKAEPDATLFKIPEGYTVKNVPAHEGGGMHHGGRGPGTPESGMGASPVPPAM